MMNNSEKEAIDNLVKNAFSNLLYIVPPLNIAMAVKDISVAAWTLYNEKSNTPQATAAKFDLILGIFCMVPGVGSPVRTSFKTILKNPEFYGPLLFDIVTLIIEKANASGKLNSKIPINPEGLLNELINVQNLNKNLDAAKQKALAEAKGSVFSKWFDVTGTVNTCFDFVKRELSSIISLFIPIVQSAILKSKQRKNAGSKGKDSKDNHDNNKPKDNPTSTGSRVPLKERIKNTKINANAFTGGVGEHIADYYCLEKLGWGKGFWVKHDMATNGNWTKPVLEVGGKLNERGKLNKLESVGNESGIDGFWYVKDPKQNGGKKYAIVEAKASMSSLGYSPKGVGSSLGSTVRKDASGNYIVQMSHDWIEDRINTLGRSNGIPSSVYDEFRVLKKGMYKKLYRRHITFSALHEPSNQVGVKHAEALFALLTGSFDEKIHAHIQHDQANHFSNENNIQVAVQTARNNAKTAAQRKKR